MNITKQLKILLSDAYEVEGELTDLIKQCFKEIFGEQAAYAYSLFEIDIYNDREYNGCLNNLEYYKQHIVNSKKYKERQEKQKKDEPNNAHL